MGVLTSGVTIKLAGTEMQVVALSRGEIVVEGPIRLNLETEASVEIARDGVARRVRGRVERCAIRSLSAAGPRYELAIAVNGAFDEQPLTARFDVPGLELGDRNPAFVANSW